MKRLLAVVCSASCLAAGAGPVLEAPGLRIELTPTGELSGSCRGGSSLVGCRMEGPVAVEKVADGCSVTREVTDGHGHRCVLTDIFRPTANSIRPSTVRASAYQMTSGTPISTSAPGTGPIGLAKIGTQLCPMLIGTGAIFMAAPVKMEYMARVTTMAGSRSHTISAPLSAPSRPPKARKIGTAS